MRKFDDDSKNYDDMTLSGLISAIGTIGKHLFNEEIATVTFGTGKNLHYIVVISKEIMHQNKVIYFVFFTKGDCNNVLISKLSTEIFINTKHTLMTDGSLSMGIKEKINAIIDNKFGGLASCGY